MWKLILISSMLFMRTRVTEGQADGELRLVNGAHCREGRLEIFYAGAWGGICDDGFHLPDGRVACKQLGFRCLSNLLIYTQGGHTDIIWMDDVACTGSETSLKECSHRGWGIHNCGTSENVGIRCFDSCEVDGNWGSWSGWNVCSASCDSGFKTRSRLCNNPVPSSKGEYCYGSSFQVLSCNNARCTVHGNWGSWSGWTVCSSSCDSGHQTRSRICDNPVPSSNGAYCNGKSFEVLNCSIARCTINGNWGSWSVWSVCSSSCDVGLQTRSRICNNPVPTSNGAYCKGKSLEVLNCSLTKCTVNGNWGSWSNLSMCSSSCDSGHQTRYRICDNPVPTSNGAYCNGKSFEVLNCSIARCIVNGNWGPWSDWSVCSSSCDSGHQTRSRICNYPAPSSNGAYCNGKSFEVLNCTLTKCTVNGNWGSWSVWTACSSSCNSGHQTRSRHCNNPIPSSNGAYCKGKSFEVLNCTLTKCTVNGNWGSWSVWTACSSSCNSGHQTRSRHCNNPIPSSNGAYCKGKSFEVLNCTLTKCTVNGDWGSWSDWTICSSSCDSGHQTRSRLCNNPTPSSNGANCTGKSFEVLNCSITRCTVDGSWGDWGKWSECNATCDGGVQKRMRYCNNPYPSAGGSTCSGMADQISICAETNCPIIGTWSEWGVWSLCSTSCGSGNRTRGRRCDNPPPSYGGEYCYGNTIDSDICNAHECPIDGDWSEWSSWDTCSATCNGGIQDRNRKCDAPLPSNGGRYCNGSTIESRSCNNENCKIDGQWSAWQEWEPCNTTCGNGSKHRIRECDSPSPYFGGSECIGLAFDIQACYLDICPDAHLQVKVETSNTVSSALLGGVAVACIVVTVVIMCVALFVFRRFSPGKVAKRKKNGCNTESLAELRVTSQQNDYDCIGRASGVQSGVYDTCRNVNSIVYTNTQFTADTIETGVRANASCNADNIESDDHANIPCNADNIEGRAHANMPCNANKVEEIYENLKIR